MVRRLVTIFLLATTFVFSTPLKVGLILGQGGLGDKSFNDSAYKGLLEAQEKFGVEIKYVEPNTWMEDSFFLEEYSENGFDLIIAASYTAQDAMESISLSYPDTKYAIVDTVAAKRDNVASLVFKEVEGSFLVGALAAKMSKTNTIGFIGATDIPLINRFKDGYVQGAKYINPNIKVNVTYIGGDAPYNDTLKGKEHAISLVNQGADVIYHASGNSGIGVMQGVKEMGVYGIGVDSNQDNLVKGKVLTSMLKNVNHSVYKIIEDTVNGNFKGDTYSFGLKESGVGVTNFEFTKDVVGKENIALLETIKNDIISGKIKINE